MKLKYKIILGLTMLSGFGTLYQQKYQTFLEFLKVQYIKDARTLLLHPITYGVAIIAIFLPFAIFCFYALKKAPPSKFDSIKSLKQIQRLNPTTFEEFIEYLYRKKGYNAQRVGFGANVKKTKKDGSYGDGGKDVIIKSFLRRDVIIQCKFYTNGVGVSVVREMFASMIHYKARKVIIITTSYFSKDAIAFAKGKKIELIDGKALEAMLK